MKISKKRLKEIIREELLKEGRFKLSGRSEMQWGGNKIVLMTGQGKIALTKKELYNMLRGIKMHRLGEGKLNEDFGHAVRQMKPYSSKEAKKVVDDGLRLWTKDVRKVEGRVIKDWMSKAKNGIIDYFDLVRGLETGDIARAHPYETKFLHTMLLKNKIIDRFRKYFGGKKGKKR